MFSDAKQRQFRSSTLFAHAAMQFYQDGLFATWRACGTLVFAKPDLEPVINFRVGGAGSQFFRVQGVRSDADRVSVSDDGRRNR